MTRAASHAHDMKNLLGIVIGYSNLLLDEMEKGDPRRADVEEILKAGQAALTVVADWVDASGGSDK